jgi:hypothetical protein
MNAAVQAARDIGPWQERYVTLTWAIGDASGEVELKARYRINYQSPFHRGRNIDPDLQLISVELQDDSGEWRVARLNSEQWVAVLSQLEEEG